MLGRNERGNAPSGTPYMDVLLSATLNAAGQIPFQGGPSHTAKMLATLDLSIACPTVSLGYVLVIILLRCSSKPGKAWSS
jgi:hypothetical protein